MKRVEVEKRLVNDLMGIGKSNQKIIKEKRKKENKKGGKKISEWN